MRNEFAKKRRDNISFHEKKMNEKFVFSSSSLSDKTKRNESNRQIEDNIGNEITKFNFLQKIKICSLENVVA